MWCARLGCFQCTNIFTSSSTVGLRPLIARSREASSAIVFPFKSKSLTFTPHSTFLDVSHSAPFSTVSTSAMNCSKQPNPATRRIEIVLWFGSSTCTCFPLLTAGGSGGSSCLNRFLDSEYTRELGDGSEENSASVRFRPTSCGRPRFFLVVWQGEHWETEEFPSPCDGKTTIPRSGSPRSGPPMELSDTCEPTGLALCRPDCFGVTFGETPDILHIHFHVKHTDPKNKKEKPFSSSLGHALPTSQNLKLL